MKLDLHMKSIQFRLVNKTHPVCRYLRLTDTARSIGLPWSAFRFRKAYFLRSYCDAAIIAEEGDKLVGFFRYDRRAYSPTLHAVGTWVDPEYRRQGIAEQMWRYAIKETGISRISVSTATRAGRKLVRALVKRLPPSILGDCNFVG